MITRKKALFMLIGCIVILSCGENTPEQQPTDDAPIEITEPEIIISVQEAEDLYKNYGKRRIPLIEEFQNIDEDGNPISPTNPGFVKATRSLSIDYNMLKEYMAFIEKQARDAKTDITGLRIYLGLYGPSGKYPNAETTFLNPLMEYGTKGDIRDDVSFAIQSIGGKPKAVAVGEILGTFAKDSQKGGTNLEMIVQSDTQSLAGNNMPRRPPPPPPIDPDYQ